ncbi:VWA domain-containing protein [Candidatus Bipolaricaulota bacterium]|nr:VWA domain-containing protein [Candidatus Bipolaricaulota bacterium]
MSLLPNFEEYIEEFKKKVREAESKRRTKNQSKQQVTEEDEKEKHVSGEGTEEAQGWLAPCVWLTILIDVSGSMGGASVVDRSKTKLDQAVKAVLGFLDTLDLQRVSVGVVSFGGQAESLIDPTNNLKRLKEKVKSVSSHGGTPLFDGMKIAYEKQLMSRTDTRVIVLTSDGKANGGVGDEEILGYADEIKEEGVKIVTIGMGSQAREEFLKKLASSTDLYFYTEAPSGLGDVLDQVAGRLALLPDEEQV